MSRLRYFDDNNLVTLAQVIKQKFGWVSITIDLTVANWVAQDDIYVQTYQVLGMTADTVGQTGLSITATEAARLDAGNCGLRVIDQGNDYIKFAVDTVPTNTIPVTLNAIGISRGA